MEEVGRGAGVGDIERDLLRENKYKIKLGAKTSSLDISLSVQCPGVHVEAGLLQQKANAGADHRFALLLLGSMVAIT